MSYDIETDYQTAEDALYHQNFPEAIRNCLHCGHWLRPPGPLVQTPHTDAARPRPAQGDAAPPGAARPDRRRGQGASGGRRRQGAGERGQPVARRQVRHHQHCRLPGLPRRTRGCGEQPAQGAG